ncbi:ribonuclease Y [Estrella lausannensis]|uniref:Ribonuclease Y n=1 Tax=Estrella lausannensis TaxID=483423 RepID=A0A0H5DRI0_9BACT|nr:ribonuclease Y [Estrella lausannensis]CRX38299.1 putative membrane protein [Estrella lausannensis]
MEEDLLFLAFTFLFGALFSACSLLIYQKVKLGGFKEIGDSIIKAAEERAQKRFDENEERIKSRLDEERTKLEDRLHKELKKIKEREDQIAHREEKIASRSQQIEKKSQETERKEAALKDLELTLHQLKADLQHKEKKLLEQLEKSAHLSLVDAQAQLLEEAKASIHTDLEKALMEAQQTLKASEDALAKKTIVTAIGRMARPLASECTVNTIALPSDEMKGRIIGKEGRNIRALERELGVTILLDETPKALVISGFDPYRMHVAKEAIKELIRDGRIHPTKIEEAAKAARDKTDANIKTWGQEAAAEAGAWAEAGAFNLHPELTHLLGRLKLRYSMGQNVLDHSLEVSHLMGLMASELGLDVKLAKRIGLLHDMGKAVTHEMDGSHAMIGYRLALQYGEGEDVASGIGAHHQEMEPITWEGALTAAADTLSAARPGARTEAAHDYVKRLGRLEEIAKTFAGVEKAYALQAGREIHVFVEPDKVSDEGAIALSREISKKVSAEYPLQGKVKVSVIREQRVIDYAL